MKVIEFLYKFILKAMFIIAAVSEGLFSLVYLLRPLDSSDMCFHTFYQFVLFPNTWQSMAQVNQCG